MYVPSSFEQKDRGEIFRFIRLHGFGTLHSASERGLEATHLPFLLEEESGSEVSLLGHMARSNPQWRDLEGGKVLAVFQGPHAYLSPSWYGEGPAVPTWNYLAVHVHGTYRALPAGELRALLEKTVDFYESGFPRPWGLPSLAEDYLEKMTGGIAGFRIRVDRMDAQWKLSQNHSAQRRERIIGALREQGGDNGLEIARRMEREMPK
jgi:transcriptional regulator